MKNHLTYLLATAALLAMAFASCSKKEPVTGTRDKEGFFLNRTSLALIKGASEALTATITPKNAGTASWSSSNEAVATVADGVVTAVGGGEAVIRAKYGSQTLSCTVWVTSVVTAVTLNEHQVDLDKGDTFRLEYTAGPEDVNVPLEISWKSTDEKVLTVDKDGLVEAVGGGKAAVVINVNGVTDVCEFFSHCQPTGIVLTPASATIAQDKTLQFTARLLPEDVTEELDFAWSVADPSIASVDQEGLVKGLSRGKTKVIVKAGAFSAEADLSIQEIKTKEVSPTSVNYTDGDVSFVFSSTCFYYSPQYGMEVPANASFTINVAAGWQIDRIEFIPSWNAGNDFTVNTGTYSRSGSNHTWVASEPTSSVTFTNPNSVELDIITFRITYTQ